VVLDSIILSKNLSLSFVGENKYSIQDV